MKAALLSTLSGVALHVAMPVQPAEELAFYPPFSPRWFRLRLAEETQP